MTAAQENEQGATATAAAGNSTPGLVSEDSNDDEYSIADNNSITTTATTLTKEDDEDKSSEMIATTTTDQSANNDHNICGAITNGDATTTTTTTKRKSMKQALLEQRNGMMCQTPPEVVELYARKLKEYAESPMFQYTLQVGDVFPNFSLPNETATDITSSIDLLSNHDYLIVTFFRGSWCRFCVTSLEILNDYIPQFQQFRTAVVAITPQTIAQNASLKESSNSISFPIVSDEHCEFAQACQVAYELDEELRPLASKIPDYNGNDDWIIPMPSTFVIRAKDNVVVYSYYEVDPWKRAEPMDLIAAIEKDVQKLKQEKDELQEQERIAAAAAAAASKQPKKDANILNDALLAEVERLEELDFEDKQSNGRSSTSSNRKSNAGRHSSSSSMRSIFREIRALKEAGIANAALKVGQYAPEFKLTDGTNTKKIYDSKKLLSKKIGQPMVILFLHGDWSPFCRITLQTWQKEYYSTIQAKGAQLIAISPSKFNKNDNDWINEIDFPILWDEHNVVLKKFRLRYQMDAKLPGQTQPWPLPMTATYILGPDSKQQQQSGHAILYAHVDCDHTKRAEPIDVIQVLPAGKVSSYPKKRGAFSLRLSGWLPIGKKEHKRG